MRLGAGIVVLAVAVGAIGWWAQRAYAPHIQSLIAARAAGAIDGARHPLTLTVEGRDIAVSGLVDTEAERARLIAALRGIGGQRVVEDRLQVLPVADPYELRVMLLDGVFQAQGTVPDARARDVLAALGLGDLPLASGAPDAAWGAAAARGVEALGLLREGTLAIVGRRMSLAGLVPTPEDGAPVRAVLDQLPDGYQADLGLSYVDDGTPAAWSVHVDAAAGGWIAGKLPQGLEPAAVAAVLGLSELDDNATRALTGDPGTVPPALGALAGWLGELETLEVAVGPDGITVTAGVGAGADTDLIAAALAQDLGAGVTTRVVSVTAEAPEGSRRTHAQTGRDEVLSGGFWLPVAGFVPAPDTCAAEADAALAGAPVGFVTGSARLDARARGAVNALAAVLGPCLRDAGLRAEIGGHTDSTGSPEANRALSLARAEAVREALIARGLPEGALTAQGYGADEPLADNATEDGRAANRRTAVRWID